MSERTAEKSADRALEGIEQYADVRGGRVPKPVWQPQEPTQPEHCCPEDNGIRSDTSTLARTEADIHDRLALNKFAQAMKKRHGEGASGGNASFLLRLGELAHRTDTSTARTLSKMHVKLVVDEALSLCAGKLAKMEAPVTGRSGGEGEQQARREQVKGLAEGVLRDVVNCFEDTIKQDPELKGFLGLTDSNRGDTFDAAAPVARILHEISRAMEGEAGPSKGGEATPGTERDPRVEARALTREAVAMLQVPAPPRPTVILAKSGQVIDAHNHASSSYHGGNEMSTRLASAGSTFAQHGSGVLLDMPIPHHIERKDSDASLSRQEMIPQETGLQKANSQKVSQASLTRFYYEDKNGPGEIVASFRRRDANGIKHFNGLPEGQQKIIHPCMTGIEMKNDDAAIENNNIASKAFAHNYVAAALKSGDRQVLVMFGEMTANKPAVPQEDMLARNYRGAVMGTAPGAPPGSGPGDDRVNVVDGVSKIVVATMLSSMKGAEEAVREYISEHPESENEIRIQHRLCLHADAVPRDSTGMLVNVGDIESYIRRIDKDIHGVVSADPSEPLTDRHQFVLQPAHLFGVSVQNHEQYDRTPVVHELIDGLRVGKGQDPDSAALEVLKVEADLSWFTATARHMSLGTASFLDGCGSTELKEIGKLIASGDKVQHEGFGHLNRARKEQGIEAEENGASPEGVVASALASAAQEKSIRIFQGFVGEIRDRLTENDGDTAHLLNTVIKNGVSATSPGGKAFADPGNFLGLLYHLHTAGETGCQGRTPFINGSDTLSTLAKFDGDLVAQVDSNQHQSVVAMLSGLIEVLGGSDDPNDKADADIYQKIFDDIHYGDQTSQPFFSANNHHYKNVSTEGIDDTVTDQEMNVQTRRGGERALWHGRQALSMKPADLPEIGLEDRVLVERGAQLEKARDTDHLRKMMTAETDIQMMEDRWSGSTGPRAEGEPSQPSPLYLRAGDSKTKIVRV